MPIDDDDSKYGNKKYTSSEEELAKLMEDQKLDDSSSTVGVTASDEYESMAAGTGYHTTQEDFDKQQRRQERGTASTQEGRGQFTGGKKWRDTATNQPPVVPEDVTGKVNAGIWPDSVPTNTTTVPTNTTGEGIYSGGRPSVPVYYVAGNELGKQPPQFPTENKVYEAPFLPQGQRETIRSTKEVITGSFPDPTITIVRQGGLKKRALPAVEKEELIDVSAYHSMRRDMVPTNPHGAPLPAASVSTRTEEPRARVSEALHSGMGIKDRIGLTTITDAPTSEPFLSHVATVDRQQAKELERVRRELPRKRESIQASIIQTKNYLAARSAGELPLEHTIEGVYSLLPQYYEDDLEEAATYGLKDYTSEDKDTDETVSTSIDGNVRGTFVPEDITGEGKTAFGVTPLFTVMGNRFLPMSNEVRLAASTLMVEGTKEFDYVVESLVEERRASRIHDDSLAHARAMVGGSVPPIVLDKSLLGEDLAVDPEENRKATLAFEKEYARGDESFWDVPANLADEDIANERRVIAKDRVEARERALTLGTIIASNIQTPSDVTGETTLVGEDYVGGELLQSSTGFSLEDLYMASGMFRTSDEDYYKRVLGGGPLLPVDTLVKEDLDQVKKLARHYFHGDDSSGSMDRVIHQFLNRDDFQGVFGNNFNPAIIVNTDILGKTLGIELDWETANRVEIDNSKKLGKRLKTHFTTFEHELKGSEHAFIHKDLGSSLTDEEVDANQIVAEEDFSRHQGVASVIDADVIDAGVHGLKRRSEADVFRGLLGDMSKEDALERMQEIYGGSVSVDPSTLTDEGLGVDVEFSPLPEYRAIRDARIEDITGRRVQTNTEEGIIDTGQREIERIGSRRLFTPSTSRSNPSNLPPLPQGSTEYEVYQRRLLEEPDPTTKAGRTKWMASRTGYFTASEADKLKGTAKASKYFKTGYNDKRFRKAAELGIHIARRREGYRPFKGNVYTEAGEAAEEHTLGLFKKHPNYKGFKFAGSAFLTSEDYEGLGATPDMMMFNKDGSRHATVEAKSLQGTKKVNAALRGKYEWQVQMQMLLAGTRYGYLVVTDITKKEKDRRPVIKRYDAKDPRSIFIRKQLIELGYVAYSTAKGIDKATARELIAEDVVRRNKILEKKRKNTMDLGDAIARNQAKNPNDIVGDEDEAVVITDENATEELIKSFDDAKSQTGGTVDPSTDEETSLYDQTANLASMDAILAAGSSGQDSGKTTVSDGEAFASRLAEQLEKIATTMAYNKFLEEKGHPELMTGMGGKGKTTVPPRTIRQEAIDKVKRDDRTKKVKDLADNMTGQDVRDESDRIAREQLTQLKESNRQSKQNRRILKSINRGVDAAVSRLTEGLEGNMDDVRLTKEMGLGDKDVSMVRGVRQMLSKKGGLEDRDTVRVLQTLGDLASTLNTPDKAAAWLADMSPMLGMLGAGTATSIFGGAEEVSKLTGIDLARILTTGINTSDTNLSTIFKRVGVAPLLTAVTKDVTAESFNATQEFNPVTSRLGWEGYQNAMMGMQNFKSSWAPTTVSGGEVLGGLQIALDSSLNIKEAAVTITAVAAVKIADALEGNMGITEGKSPIMFQEHRNAIREMDENIRARHNIVPNKDIQQPATAVDDSQSSINIKSGFNVDVNVTEKTVEVSSNTGMGILEQSRTRYSNYG